MHEKVKKTFTILSLFTFFHPSDSIIFNIELIIQIIIILILNVLSIYSTQKIDKIIY